MGFDNWNPTKEEIRRGDLCNCDICGWWERSTDLSWGGEGSQYSRALFLYANIEKDATQMLSFLNSDEEYDRDENPLKIRWLYDVVCWTCLRRIYTDLTKKYKVEDCLDPEDVEHYTPLIKEWFDLA